MSYEDAIKKAEEEAKFFPCGREEGGREWVEVEKLGRELMEVYK